ncbi:hypothetical protein [Paraprevotella xylaniphila]|jgi:hypothetical protein|uniref:hypothetical protein n=1 Tax=Paraprevotella xylaniphila TaxID=454155 RepID=UPI001032DAC4|nr:hypothetical protein [Paraprevotella xylaniphila]
MNKGAKNIANAIIDLDFKTVVVNNKAYTVYPPTIEKLSGAISFLSEVRDADTFKDVLLTLGDADKYANALSWFITGNESLYQELKQGSYKEVVDALETCISMIDIELFQKAVSLAKNVGLLAAKQK